MTHRSADRLSDSIDHWLGGGKPDETHLSEVLLSLAAAFPEVADELARERVRRRLAGVSPRPRSPQELLLERAGESLERLSHRVTEDDYVPWTTVAGAAVVVIVAAVALSWLRHRGGGRAELTV
jgi:hypothetical protein